jgi:putative restriction endonuclease
MSKQPRRNWLRSETLIAFGLYCRTPFGELHQSNPAIVELSGRLGRTPSAVGMKACNFASLDPRQRER